MKDPFNRATNSATVGELRTDAPVVVLPSEHQISIETDIISAKVSDLFIRGLDVAMELLNSDIAQLQLPIARTILVAATKLLGQASDQEARELRTTLDRMWEELRNPDVKANAAPPAADDPNETAAANPPRP